MLATLRKDLASVHPALIWRAVRINIFSLSLMALWTPLNIWILPDRITATASASIQGSALGLVSLAGVGIAAVVQPLAGRWSDLTHLPDRRRPFIIGGAAADLLFLVVFWWAPTFLWLLVAYILLQVSSNVAQAAFQALIPDLFKPANRGVASGAKNALTVIGAAIGLFGAAVLLRWGDGIALLYVGAILAAGAGLTWRWVPCVPPMAAAERAETHHGGSLLGEIRTTFIGPLRHPTFAQAVLAQFLFMLGVYPAERFLRFFLKDRFGVTTITTDIAVSVVIIIILGVAGAVLAGHFSDSLGRIPVLRIAIALTVAGLVGFALAPDLAVVALAGALMALGVGAFLSVNWALLTDHIPQGRGARFLGVANIATAGAGALAGLFGPIVDIANAVLPAGTYTVTFGLAAMIALASLLPLRHAASQSSDQQPAPGQSGQRAEHV